MRTREKGKFLRMPERKSQEVKQGQQRLAPNAMPPDAPSAPSIIAKVLHAAERGYKPIA